MKLNFLGRVPEKMKSMAPINQGAFFFWKRLHLALIEKIAYRVISQWSS